MKKIKIGVFLIIEICSLGIVSCRNEENTITSLHEFPQRYERSTDNININTEIVIDENSDEFLYDNKAMRIDIHEDQLLKDLMLKNEQQDEVFRIDKWMYGDNKGQTLYIKDDSIAFISSSNNYKTMQKIIQEQTISNQNSIEKNSYDVNIEDYKERIELEKQLKSWGLEDFKLYEEHKINKSDVLGSTWYGYEKYQGLFVFSNKYYSNLSGESAPLQIMKSEDIIEKLQLLYGYEFVKGKDKIQLKTFDEIADSLEKEYSMVISDNQHEAIKAELAFLVKDIHDKEKLDMEPVWIITIHEFQKNNKANYREYQEIYSAITACNVG